MSTRGITIQPGWRIPESAFTLSGFRRWAHSSKFPRRGKASFLSGEVILEMSPEEIRSHNSAKRDVTNHLCHHVFRLDLGEVFADRVLLINEAAGLATEPDAMFCRWETLESGKATLVERRPGSGRQVELHGSPDLVVEIVSKASAQKDKQQLRQAYFRAEIPQYWIIDARGKQIEFTMLRRGETGYVETAADNQGFRTSDVLGRRVQLTRELNRIGGWRYTLQLNS